jgi:general stress protein YciG
MNLKSLQRKAKQMIDRRGGTDSVRADAEELKDIAKGPGSFADKAKRAGEALKDPGAKEPDTPTRPRSPDPGEPVSAERPAGSSTPPAEAPDTSKPNQPPGV